MIEWQPIETAPKDGTEILGWGAWAGEINGAIENSTDILVIYWSGGHTDYPGYDWYVCGGDAYSAWMKPTFWMPLPEPPKGATP